MKYMRTGLLTAALLCVAIAAGCGGGGVSPAVVRAGSTPFVPVKVKVPRVSVPQSTASPGTFPHTVTLSGTTQLLTVGPDRLYYSVLTGIGAVTYAGVRQNGPATGDGGSPQGLIEGLDGAIYYGENVGTGLNKYLPTGVGVGTMTHWNDFDVTTTGTEDVTSDPNGILWYTEYNNASVVGMTTWGSIIKRTQLAAGSHPVHIAVGVDGSSLWVTERTGNAIAKLDLSGNLVGEYPLPGGCANTPEDIAPGKDGNMYFTEDVSTSSTQSYIGQVTPSGVISCKAAPELGSTTGIAQGPDGNIWFLEHDSPHIVKYNLTTYSFDVDKATSGGNPQKLVLGGDGELWWVNYPGSTMVSYQPN